MLQWTRENLLLEPLFQLFVGLRQRLFGIAFAVEFLSFVEDLKRRRFEKSKASQVLVALRLLIL